MEKAGTALRGALTRLLKPSKQNEEGFQQLGISVEDFKKGTLTLPDMLDKIKNNTNGWTDAQRTSAIALAFGTESQSAMNVLVNQGGDAMRNLTAETKNSSGATKKISDEMSKLPANKVKQFQETLKVLGITIGEKLLPVFTPLLEKATDMINKFSELDNATQMNIIKWGGLAMAAGPALKVLGGGISVIGNTRKSIGELGKSIVEMSANAAAKKALVGGLTTAVSEAGSAATAAAGVGTATGIAGFGGTLLSVLGPIGLVAGGLAAGYGAWKLFGEEAWNSSQRVKDWGVDVGQTTTETMNKVKTNTGEAAGQFSLMAQGLDVDVPAMTGNFVTMGQTIEQSLLEKVKGLDKLIKQLPDTVDTATQELLQNEKDKTEEALKTVQENNNYISQIKKNAANENRELSIQEMQTISDLSKNTTEAYVSTLDVSTKKRKEILAAMTGDVEQASEKEAKIWLQTLGKQRQAAQENATKSRKEQEENLQKLGYQLNGEFAQNYLAGWDNIQKTTTDGFDAQMATIAAKYPELVKEVHFGSGQLIDETANAGDMLIKDNEKIIESHKNMANKLAANATENAKKIGWTAKASDDSTKKAALAWNSLVFDPKTQEVKSNVAEVVTEAAKDANTWNDMKLLVHDANLDSNAKKVIGEAAIANGWWDGMAWEDKQAILQDEFSINVFNALRDNGKWNELTFDQKKAILYTNTPEEMAQTMFDLGLWEEYKLTPKAMEANNAQLLEAIYQSEEKTALWNSLTVPEKKFLANNTDFALKILNSKTDLEAWNKMPASLKDIIARNKASEEIIPGTADYEYWMSLPDSLKKILTESDLTGVDEVKKALDSVHDKNVKITVEGTTAAAIPTAKGTNSHPGGLALVNDQKGPLYREYVELPNGVGFIPQARNTVLPLPRGSKVLKASKTKRMFPRYAGGIGQITENTATPTTDFTADLEAQMEQYFVIGADWMQRLIDGWNSLTATHLANVNTFANQNVAALNSWDGQMYTSGYTWLQNNLNGWNALYSTFVNRVNQLANDSVNTLQSKSGDMYNAGNYLMQNLLNGLNSMGSALDGVMRGVANKMLSGIGKGVNGVITGVNHVLKQVESDKTLSSWSVPQYAKGTEGHPGGLAMINDQRGTVHEEYVQMPDGQGFIAKGRDLLVNLPKGAQVLNARLTEKLKKRVDIPHYADGIGDMEIDIEELINNKEVFKKLINDQIQYASIMEPWKNMTSSAVKVMTDQAYEFVKKKAEELFMGSGSRAEFIKNVLAQKGKQYVWGAEGPDTFDCSGLIKWALGQIGISFPHYTGDQWNATDHITEAEAKPGDLIYFGSNASRHVGMYTKKGEMFNASMPNAYGPGNGIGYSPYAAADLWGFARIRQLTDGIASGGGRNYGGNWANAIRDAAKKMRVSINGSDVQTILSLIQHESGGNEKIVQSSSVWDINMANGNPARGLLQFIPSTFSAYAVKGYNNIMSGYDQLLALFNNANWRGDIHPWGGWGPTGRRRYENGGLITHEQIARVGEGNKPEMVIPLTRKARAIQLIDKAKDYLGIGDDAPAVVGGRTDLSAVEGKLDQVIDLLSAILGKDPHYVLDLIKTAREMEPYITKYQSRTQKSNQRRGGIRV